MRSAFTTPSASWDLLADLQQLVAYPFMRHAFVAGALVAMMTAAVGWFMVLRMQAYAGHTLSVVGFPGAAGAALLGVPQLVGYFAACVGSALILALIAPRSADTSRQSATIGTVQAVALGIGLLFVSLSSQSLRSSMSLLFGSFTGVTSTEVWVLAAVALTVLCAMGTMARPLLFASVDREVANSRRVPVRLLGLAFLVVLALAVAATSQFTGSLLVFALLVAPPAAAQRLTLRPLAGVALSCVFALLTAWLGLSAAYFSGYPVGFLIASAGLLVYAIARVLERRHA